MDSTGGCQRARRGGDIARIGRQLRAAGCGSRARRLGGVGLFASSRRLSKPAGRKSGRRAAGVEIAEMDGWEVLRQIKSDPRLKAIPIVVFTFSRAASDLAHSYQLGANAYVVKPAHLRQRAAVL